MQPSKFCAMLNPEVTDMRVLCFGDSNTYGYDPRSYFGSRYDSQNRWVDLLAAKTGWELLNAGQNGREIPRRTHELQQIRQLLNLSGPVDAMLIMLGDNDLLQGASVEAVTARMRTFLTQLPHTCGKIVLVSPPPLKPGTWISSPQTLEDVRILSSCYQTLAEQLHIHFISTLDWNLELTFDGVHFSEKDHAQFSEKLFAALTELSIL